MGSKIVFILFCILVFNIAGAYSQAIPPPFYPPLPSDEKKSDLKSIPDLQKDFNKLKNTNPAEIGRSIVFGRVVSADPQGYPDESHAINGALIRIFDASGSTTCISGNDGSFSINNLSKGEKHFEISASGYHIANGTIWIDENMSKSLLISLSPLQWRVKRKLGYINVIAYGKEDSSGKWIGVKSIRVHEKGTYSPSWQDFWDGQIRTNYQCLYCSGARLGKYYQVKVEWSDGSSRTSDILLQQKYRDISIYPW